MSLRPIKLAVQYILGACAIAFFVTLLSFIFSFLGTIFCAALAGMMFGSIRSLRWQSAALSCLFPVVIVTLLRSTNAALPASQIAFLGAACFATFWAAYGAGVLLTRSERKTGSVASASSGAPAQQAMSNAAESRARAISGQLSETRMPAPRQAGNVAVDEFLVSI